MKKVFLMIIVLGVAMLSVAAFTGCQQASTSSSTTTLSSTSAKSYASTASQYANQMIHTMAGWAGGGAITPFSVRGSSVDGKSLTVSPDPDANGYYSVTGTMYVDSVPIVVALHAKLSPSGTPTDVAIYGTETVSVSGETITLTYGNGESNPCTGHITYAASGSTVTNVSVSGAFTFALSGSANVTMAITYSNFSVPIGGGYPNGSMTIAITQNNAAQPNMTIVFNGSAFATWSYNGESGSFQAFEIS